MQLSRPLFLVSFIANWIVPIVVGAAVLALYMVMRGPALGAARTIGAMSELFQLNFRFAFFLFSMPSGALSLVLTLTMARLLARSTPWYFLANTAFGTLCATLCAHFAGGPLSANQTLVPALIVGSMAGYFLSSLLVWVTSVRFAARPSRIS